MLDSYACLRVAVILVASTLGQLLAEAPAAAAAPDVIVVRDTQLDPTALYLVSFDGLVNNASYQQSAILSFAGYQYAAWYTASRDAVVARHRLPAGAWEIAILPHRLSTNDSHNSISLGISPADGRLHIAMDTHDSTVFYIKSEAGLVSSPATRTWSAARFGSVQRTLDGVELGAITYLSASDSHCSGKRDSIWATSEPTSFVGSSQSYSPRCGTGSPSASRRASHLDSSALLPTPGPPVTTTQ